MTMSNQITVQPHGALIHRFARHADSDGEHVTAVDGLKLIRASAPSERYHVLYDPGLCMVLQGRKRVRLGEDVFHYDPLNYLVVSFTVPVVGQVIEATPEAPFLCVRLDIDLREISDLMLTMDTGGHDGRSGSLQTAPVAGPMLNALGRLLDLLDTPGDAPVLGPLVIREIFYRVLTGDLGARLRELVVADSRSQRIARVIDLIKQRYREAVRIEELAEAAHMSPSTLHHHFKTVTSLSPLQFQKQLRLHEARRLMLTEGVEAVTAGHEVGYQSPSQFSREYRRLFGAPPRAEIKRLRVSDTA